MLDIQYYPSFGHVKVYHLNWPVRRRSCPMKEWASHVKLTECWNHWHALLMMSLLNHVRDMNGHSISAHCSVIYNKLDKYRIPFFLMYMQVPWNRCLIHPGIVAHTPWQSQQLISKAELLNIRIQLVCCDVHVNVSLKVWNELAFFSHCSWKNNKYVGLRFKQK